MAPRYTDEFKIEAIRGEVACRAQGVHKVNYV
jgi:hypothetical protein